MREPVEKFLAGTSIEELITHYGEPILSAIHAAESLNGSTKYNWNEILQISYKKEQLARQLEPRVEQLYAGEDVDFSDLDFDEVQESTDGIKKASEVEALEIPLTPSGFEPIDNVVGGIPQAGLETLLAYTSNGKTTYVLKRADTFLSHHKDKNALIISTEMLEEENKMRLEEIDAKNLDRIYLQMYLGGVKGLSRIIDQVPNLGFVVIDMIDDLIQGEVSEPAMSEVYQTLSGLSRKFRVPILASALPHRAQNKVLRPHNFRWSSMAEGRAYMVTTLYNPMKSTVGGSTEDPLLPRRPNIAWLCVWKVRGGIRVQKYKDITQVAIPMYWHPEKGFANKFLPSPTVFSLEDDKDN